MAEVNEQGGAAQVGDQVGVPVGVHVGNRDGGGLAGRGQELRGELRGSVRGCDLAPAAGDCLADRVGAGPEAWEEVAAVVAGHGRGHDLVALQQLDRPPGRGGRGGVGGAILEHVADDRAADRGELFHAEVLPVDLAVGVGGERHGVGARRRGGGLEVAVLVLQQPDVRRRRPGGQRLDLVGPQGQLPHGHVVEVAGEEVRRGVVLALVADVEIDAVLGGNVGTVGQAVGVEVDAVQLVDVQPQGTGLPVPS